MKPSEEIALLRKKQDELMKEHSKLGDRIWEILMSDRVVVFEKLQEPIEGRR